MFLLALDAGKKTLASERYRIRSVDMWTTPAGISTVVDAPRVAAREYHDLFWEDMRTDLERDGIAFDSLVLAYTMANLDRWPASCSRKAGSPSLEDFQAIGTGLKISSCDVDLLVLAAHQLVHDQMNGETGRRLEKLGISVRRVDE